jgi:hypothetical protein
MGKVLNDYTIVFYSADLLLELQSQGSFDRISSQGLKVDEYSWSGI